MAVSKASFGVVAVAAVLFFVISLPAIQAQPFAPAPAPTSDGTTIDQAIGYMLMLLALVITYLVHVTDLPYAS